MLKHLFELKRESDGISTGTGIQRSYKSPHTKQEAYVLNNNYCITVDNHNENENDICISKF